MKIFFLIVLFVISNMTYTFGQTETEHFVYDKGSINVVVSLKGKEKIDTLFPKMDVHLEGQGVAWIVNARVKPFQELIDEGTFSRGRMQELEKVDDSLNIYVFFDETGVVYDIYFSMPIARKSLLTEKELYCIYEKYLGTVYDLTDVVAWDDNSLTPKKRTTFLAFDLFNIPFKDLKY